MRVKTSVSLSTDVLDHVGLYASGGERSDFVEKALWNYLDFLRRKERDQQDLERINAAAAYLNDEAKDTLDYQVTF
jgi:metal-responsive CopG/Arc/MetJ family transcriptional regulator